MDRTVTEPNIGVRIGAAIRSTSEGFGWSQRELARRLGTNPSAVRRLQRGEAIDVELATAALDLLGIRMILDANPIGLIGRMEQRDFVHARCCAYVARELERRGWVVQIEVEIGDGRSRGWIDIVAWRASDGALLVIEVKTAVDDVGRLLRTMGWYVRSSREAVRPFGWRPRAIVPIVLALATEETEARLVANGSLLKRAYPGHVVSLNAWIDNPLEPGPEPTMALIDPRRRRAAWLQRPRADGGRTAVPYRGYADAAAALGRR